VLVDVLAAGGTKVRDLIVRQRYSDLLRHAPIHIANAARSRQRQDRGRATALHSHCQARQLLVFIGNVVQFFAGFFVAQAGNFELLLFLGIISINLAVVNFLPIPILDGGHMVFLIYEKLRGRPPTEKARVIATYIGLAMIGFLMLFVFYQDIQNYVLKMFGS